MFFKADAWPGELHVARALFAGPIDRDPQAHVYYDMHAPWVRVADDLPKKPDPASPEAGKDAPTRPTVGC